MERPAVPSVGPGAATVAGLVAAASAAFRAAGLPTPDLDARLLAAEALGLSRGEFSSRSDDVIDPPARRRLDGFVARRLAGEPAHRILGRRAFYDHDFALSKDTLEPRPDTELLVDEARPVIAAIVAERDTCLFADIGTGTGAVAISLLALFERARAIGVDIAPGALETAVRNARTIGVADRFEARRSNYLDEIEGPLDLVVSNPPYIRSGDIDGLDEGVRRFDPRIALDGGNDGLLAYRSIAVGAAGRLTEEGRVLVEIGQGQETGVAEIFAAHDFALVRSAEDLSGITRVLSFQRRAHACDGAVR